MTHTSTRPVIELTKENIGKVAPVTEEWTLKDICDLLGRNPEDWSDITINKEAPIGRQGDVLQIASYSKHFIDPEMFNLELKKINTDVLQRSTLNGNDHRIVSVNSDFEVFESKGVNQYEAYSKLGLETHNWMKSTTVGNMYLKLNEGAFLAHNEHNQRILPKGFFEIRIQNAVDISGFLRKQLD